MPHALNVVSGFINGTTNLEMAFHKTNHPQNIQRLTTCDRLEMNQIL